MKVDAGGVHDRQHDGQHQRDGQGDHDTSAPAQRQEAHQENDGECLDEGFDELGDPVLDNVRLVRDLRHAYSDRKLGDDRIHRGFQILAERQNVGAILHRDAEAERGLTAFADDELGDPGSRA